MEAARPEAIAYRARRGLDKALLQSLLLGIWAAGQRGLKALLELTKGCPASWQGLRWSLGTLAFPRMLYGKPENPTADLG